MEKFSLMLVISLLFVALWVFIGLAVALYVRANTEVVVVPDDSFAKHLIKCPDGEASCNASGHD
jgi:hypothetical protein